MIKILLVEDDLDIVTYLSEILEEEGYRVKSVTGQKDAIALLEDEKFHLLLIDISLSDGNGYAVCAAAKELTDAGIIFLTASGDEYSVVTGLDLGADDYIAKPFRPRELISRIKTVLRRVGGKQTTIRLANLQIDTARAKVLKNGQEVFLTALEYRLFLILLNNRGQVLSRNILLEHIWDVAGDFVNDNTLTVYIKRLREKIEDDPSNPQVIKTVRGQGYEIF